uniref:Nucleotidyltransferase n=1 Tax=uncultured Thiotrichaceae bacterium TaxID=298394 RepID=A0A6S6UGW7_9GAMM|nr:MAG: Unknown protein [uncultured Thiotrichaceae bacterium]
MYIPEQDKRQLVAEEAARLIYDEGYRDYRLAKLKAAERMGASTQGKSQPTNDEIETALHSYISLFADEEQLPILRKHREIAVEALTFLKDFNPYLTGAALEGTSGPHSAVTLFLVANRAEDVIFFMEDEGIPFQTHDRKVRFGNRQDYYPLLRFYADDVEVELMIFPDTGQNNGGPISPITGKSSKRADLKKLKQLLADMP